MFPGVADSLNMAIRRFIPPPEHRPKHEIEAEVREEIEFHLAMTAERIAEEERLDSGSAKAEALKRFGDPESITRECTRIALKERIMLQRINTVLIALVAIGLIVVGIGTWQQQAQTAAAFEQINEKLTGMAAVQAEPRGQELDQSPAVPESPKYVEVSAGDRREMVTLTPDLRVADALRKVFESRSPVPIETLRVDITGTDGQGDTVTVFRSVLATIDYVLQPSDSIYVTRTDADLPWVLYSPAEEDQPAVEASRTRMFEVQPDAPEQISLQRVFETAAAQLELRLVINAQDVKDYEYTLDVTIPAEFLESLTIGQALDYACLNVYSIDFEDVSWDVHEGTLIVGSVPFIADRATVTATYRVDDLLGPFPSRDEYQDLREILTTAAGFDYWRDHGGDVSLYTEVEGRLSITTIPRFHRSISMALESLHDPQQHYPRTTLHDKGWFRTWLALSNTTIGSGLTENTTVVEAVHHALERADLPGHIAINNLENIGFEGDNVIGISPEPVDSAARLLTQWLGVASPDDFDRAAWMAYGGGIAVASERTLRQIRSVRVYDVGELKPGADDEFMRSIIELIQTRVDFDGWRDNGGDTGIMQTFGGLLIITTTDANHIEIVRLLDEYRAANAVASSDRAAAASTSRGTVYIRGLIERPGVYNLPDGDGSFTFSRLIAAAGGLSAGFDRTALLYAVQRFVPEQGHTTIFLDWDKLDGFVLLGDDLVDITRRPSRAER